MVLIMIEMQAYKHMHVYIIYTCIIYKHTCLFVCMFMVIRLFIFLLLLKLIYFRLKIHLTNKK